MKLRELCENYNKTDSISTKQDLEDKIIDIAKEYIDTRVGINSEFNQFNSIERWPFSEYRIDSGSLSLNYVSSEKIHLDYNDSWRYGGSCSDSIVLSLDEIENFCLSKYVLTLIHRNKLQMKSHIRRLTSELDNARKKLANIEITEQNVLLLGEEELRDLYLR